MEGEMAKKKTEKTTEKTISFNLTGDQIELVHYSLEHAIEVTVRHFGETNMKNGFEDPTQATPEQKKTIREFWTLIRMFKAKLPPKADR
jgi:hypothetical protein